MEQRMERILRNVDILPSLNLKVRTGGRLNLQRMIDSDSNELPDWWELTYFGQLTETDPNADADHDGATNLLEFLMDTNPLDSNSSLRILDASREPTGTRVSWSGGAQSSQILQRASSPEGPWVNIFTNVAPTPLRGTYLDVEATNNSGFYRLRAERP